MKKSGRIWFSKPFAKLFLGIEHFPISNVELRDKLISVLGLPDDVIVSKIEDVGLIETTLSYDSLPPCINSDQSSPLLGIYLMKGKQWNFHPVDMISVKGKFVEAVRV